MTAPTGTDLATRLERQTRRGYTRGGFMKYGLLWLLGVPVPVLIVIYLMFHH